MNEYILVSSQLPETTNILKAVKIKEEIATVVGSIGLSLPPFDGKY